MIWVGGGQIKGYTDIYKEFLSWRINVNVNIKKLHWLIYSIFYPLWVFLDNYLQRQNYITFCPPKVDSSN